MRFAVLIVPAWQAKEKPACLTIEDSIDTQHTIQQLDTVTIIYFTEDEDP